MSRNIDKIVLEEKAEDIRRQVWALSRADRANEALRWFAEYAVEKAPGSPPKSDVLKMNVDVIESSTPHVKPAQDYVKKAAVEFEQKILARAIQLAWIDHDSLKDEEQ
jgi:hypothetical protein